MKARDIAIVLTGNGNDGTDGSSAIHSNGGVVMVQEPSTAEFKSMPQSMVTNDHPNFVMPIDRLVATLKEFIKAN